MKGTVRINRKRMGFTLIELLVVIAIIAILAAILFPVLVSVRMAAHKASCQTQMHQVGMAMISYTSDNNNRFVPYLYNWHNRYYETIDYDNNPVWPRIIQRYIANKYDVLRCPSARVDPSGMWNPANTPPNGTQQYWVGNWEMWHNVGYSYFWLSPIEGYHGNTYATPVFLTTPVNPSKTVMLAESTLDSNKPYSYGTPIVDPPLHGDEWDAAHAADNPSYGWHGGWLGITPSDVATPYGYIGFRHSGVANVVWVDGHVTAMRAGQLSDLTLWDLK